MQTLFPKAENLWMTFDVILSKILGQYGHFSDEYQKLFWKSYSKKFLTNWLFEYQKLFKQSK